MRFHGKVGYGSTVDTVPGVHEDVIVERELYGDVVRNDLRKVEGEKVIEDLALGHSISVVADAYANEHYFSMKYVEWAGQRWTIVSVEVQPPRLLLHLGEVYHGPTNGAPESP